MNKQPMLHFDSDYMEGAHPLILEKLCATNLEKTPGYGTDTYCDSAKQKIRQACITPEADIYFLVGGTQTNATVIDALLQSYEGVLAADTGHISVHEAGAIETSGHKVLTIPQEKGKVTAQAARSYLRSFYADANHAHMVQPGMLYISHPTECGTLYAEDELCELHKLCAEYQIPLFLDGARLGYGLAADPSVSLPVIAKYCDVFYIGGTKVGALFGEAVVFPRPLSKHFFTIMKAHGALLAKGRLLGIQFDTLFTDDLYLTISKQAIAMANKLEEGFKAKGYRMCFDSPTNQRFVLLENNQMKELAKKVSFSYWEAYDESHTIVRFATSWATTSEEVEQLLQIL